MFCNRCGRELFDGAKFCPSCGKEVRKTSHEDYYDAFDDEYDDYEDDLPNKRMRIVAICSSLVALVITGVVLAIVITGSGDDVKEDKAVATVENSPQEATETGSAGNPVAVSPEQPESDSGQVSDGEPSDLPGWKALYLSYIDGLEGKEGLEYKLLYLDDDDIPELVINTYVAGGGATIVSVKNDTVTDFEISGDGFGYIERQGLIISSYGQMGWYPTDIIKLDENGFSKILSAEMGETRDPDSDEWINTYSVEGKEVSEEEYNKSIDDIYDPSKNTVVEDFVKYDDIVSELKTK